MATVEVEVTQDALAIITIHMALELLAAHPSRLNLIRRAVSAYVGGGAVRIDQNERGEWYAAVEIKE